MASKEQQRAELHKIIWRIANDLRGSVDGWDFKSYVLGILFYRFISENLTAYLNKLEQEAGDADFDYAKLSDKDAEFGRKDTVDEKGFYILPSELFENVRKRASRDENLNETLSKDVVFEIELIKQVEINVDYILMLVAKWREARGNGADKELSALMDIQRSVDSSPTLRNKKDLILDFVDRVSASGEIDEEWRQYIQAQRTTELEAIISDENLKPDETRAFVDHAFRDGSIPTTGTAITKILPPASRFSAGGSHGEKKARALDRLGEFFDCFFGLSSGTGEQ